MKTILCFGDSNTWGYVARKGTRLSAAQRWTGVMRQILGEGYDVIEEGLNGRTTVFDDPDETHRSGADYLLPCLKSHSPLDIVIIMLGTNDLKDKFELCAKDIAAGMERLIDITEKSASGREGVAPEILLICPPRVAPVTDFDDFRGSHGRSGELCSRYSALAEKLGCAFLDASLFIGEELLPDGVHLNGEAHAALGARAAEKVKEIIGERQKTAYT